MRKILVNAWNKFDKLLENIFVFVIVILIIVGSVYADYCYRKSIVKVYEKNCEEIGIGNNSEMCFVFTLEQLNQLHLEIREKLNNIQ